LLLTAEAGKTPATAHDKTNDVPTEPPATEKRRSSVAGYRNNTLSLLTPQRQKNKKVSPPSGKNTPKQRKEAPQTPSRKEVLPLCHHTALLLVRCSCSCQHTGCKTWWQIIRNCSNPWGASFLTIRVQNPRYAGRREEIRGICEGLSSLLPA